MNTKVLSPFLIASALASTSSAAVVVQWNFNSSNTTASLGSGSASLIGGTTATFATGFSGSNDFAWNTTNYPAQGTSNRTAGVQFGASTADYSDISLTWNIRHSNTAANTIAVLATNDGSTWNEVALFTFTPAASGTGDTWYSRSVTLGSEYSNSANFAFRVVTAFAPNTSTYLASRSTSTYGTSSTLRFDNVTVNGTLIPAPGAVALLGVATLVGTRRRR